MFKRYPRRTKLLDGTPVRSCIGRVRALGLGVPVRERAR